MRVNDLSIRRLQRAFAIGTRPLVAHSSADQGCSLSAWLGGNEREPTRLSGLGLVTEPMSILQRTRPFVEVESSNGGTLWVAGEALLMRRDNMMSASGPGVRFMQPGLRRLGIT